MDAITIRTKGDELHDALIVAGINELELHGLAGFSLRRVAAACGVSCAAPYRHFKSKDDLILAIISYIDARWSLLCDHICRAFEGDTHKILVEVCIANIRFWIANPNFRSVMMLDDRSLDSLQIRERSKLTDSVRLIISKYCGEKKVSTEAEAKLTFSLFSLIYGSTQMLGSGQIDNSPESINMIKCCIEDAISASRDE